MNPSSPVLIALASAALASAAVAHPLPRTASPAPNAALTASPPEIRITFSEAVVAAFSGLALKDQAGKAADIGPAAVDPKHHAELAAPVKAPLAAGTYTVSWHAVGDDTHHTSGHYSFQVK